MSHRIQLPASLPDSFSIAQAAAAGVGWERASAADLLRPFVGVRSAGQPTTPFEHARQVAPRLRPGQRLGGLTAARLWGLPLPWFWSADESIEITVPPDARPPSGRGVTGSRLAPWRTRDATIAGLPVVDPVAAVFQLAPRLRGVDITPMLDALVTDARNYPEPHPRRQLATVESVAARLDAWGRFAGKARLRLALPLAREHVESPGETRTRCIVVAAGLPEPTIQHEVVLPTGSPTRTARIDLSYPHLRVAIEYDGDWHRSPSEWRRGIRRIRALEAAGWIVIRVMASDIADPASFLAAIERAIAVRSH